MDALVVALVQRDAARGGGDAGDVGGVGAEMASWTRACTSAQSGCVVENPSLPCSNDTDVRLASFTRRPRVTMRGSWRLGMSVATMFEPALVSDS